jgi:hypothetical protein
MWRSTMTNLAVAFAALLRPWRLRTGDPRSKGLPPTRHPRRVRVLDAGSPSCAHKIDDGVWVTDGSAFGDRPDRGRSE